MWESNRFLRDMWCTGSNRLATSQVVPSEDEVAAPFLVVSDL